jgi:SET domain-containing protein
MRDIQVGEEMTVNYGRSYWVFGCIKTFSVIRKTRRKRKRRTQCGG